MLRNKIRRYLKHGTLTQLKVFAAVARLGSFTRAAEELHMAQPTVSVQLKKLGETAGLPLFERRGRKFRLTPAGCRLDDACRQIFDTLSELEDSFAQLREYEARRPAIRKPGTGLSVACAQSE